VGTKFHVLLCLKIKQWLETTHFTSAIRCHHAYKEVPFTAKLSSGKTFEVFTIFLQLQIYSCELFEYIIPFNFHISHGIIQDFKVQKDWFVPQYLLFLNIEQDC